MAPRNSLIQSGDTSRAAGGLAGKPDTGMVPEGELTLELRTILGDADFVRFAQEFGGTRVYIPVNPSDDNDIVQALGRPAAEKLSHALAPDTIRVPLARRIRAMAYRAAGLSNSRIARKLGITENGVAKLFAREADLPGRASKTLLSGGEAD